MNKLNHVSFIMDGNGRWAKERNKNRVYGHNEGVRRIPEIVKHCIKKEIKNVSFFAFSTENWNRSKTEVSFLLNLLNKNLTNKLLNDINELGIRIYWIGFKKNVPKKIIDKILFFEEKTKQNNKINVFFYFNYGFIDDLENAKNEIIECGNKEIPIKNFLKTSIVPNIDLLIRTSGESRISNFSLYELAYSEIIFEKTYWPDYTIEILDKNIKEFERRDRRYGKA